jgi:hypothetical protein
LVSLGLWISACPARRPLAAPARTQGFYVSWHLGFAYWPRDRLFGFRSDAEGVLELDLGETQERCELLLNYKARSGGSIRVELPDRPGYELADAIPLEGDEVAGVVAWRSGAQISPLPDKPLIIRLHVDQADVYAYALRKWHA